MTSNKQKQELPKFIKNRPHGEDKFEGRSAERIADAIKLHIESVSYTNKDETIIPQIIGLDGEWGSGKSNVIRILKEKIKDNFYIFEYDTWGHQEDLQRRSFLETLTNDLIKAEDSKLLPEKCSKLNCDKKNEKWDEKLKNLLARKRETILKSRPKISAGIIGAILLFILTPITSVLADDPDLTFICKLLIASSPLSLAIITWIIFSCFKRKLVWEELFFIYRGDKTEDIINETISENEPSVREFKDWMSDLSKDLCLKKLIIVFDDMDRLPAEKVKELWSSIHTFFSIDGYPNIWVIIPFDRNHLARAFGNDKNKEEIKGLTEHFINKTFPVIYTVAPPVLTDWKKIFNEFFEEAFGHDLSEEKVIVQRIFGLIKIHFTPRDIIAFINELVSIKRIWRDQIPLRFIALYSLRKNELLEKPSEVILSGSYLTNIEKIIENNDETQEFIAALVYGIDIEMAAQIPIKQYIEKTLRGNEEYNINDYSENKHFIQILDEVIPELDVAILDKAILSLSKYEKKEGQELTNQWNELSKILSKQNIDSLTFNVTHQFVLVNCDSKNQEKFVKYLYKSFSNFKEFDGKKFYETMSQLEYIIYENEIKISLAEFVKEKQVSPEIFVAYANIALDKYEKYKLITNNEALNNYLISLIPNLEISLSFLEYVIEDENYSFQVFKNRIEKAISENEITIGNFPELIKSYKLISGDKPLKHQLTPAQINNLLPSISKNNLEAYYDLVAMELCNKLINTPYKENLDERIAERIEYYKDYGELLELSVNWSSDLLRKSIRLLTLKSFGPSRLEILKTLQLYEGIKSALSVSDNELLKRLNSWEKFAKEKVTAENVDSVIQNSNLFRSFCETKNNLTTHLNEVAIVKLGKISIDEIYSQRTTPTYYWLNCAYIFIQEEVLSTLPDNFTEFSKKVLKDISTKSLNIPQEGDLLDTIINRADKRKLHPTIKEICTDFCNKTISITPELFLYFEMKFDMVKKVTSRDGDITSVVFSSVINDPKCLNFILDKKDNYIKIVNNAGDDANDFKIQMQRLIESNKADQLVEFAISIGVELQQDKKEEN
jgi:hypothetical protein